MLRCILMQHRKSLLRICLEFWIVNHETFNFLVVVLIVVSVHDKYSYSFQNIKEMLICFMCTKNAINPEKFKDLSSLLLWCFLEKVFFDNQRGISAYYLHTIIVNYLSQELFEIVFKIKEMRHNNSLFQ